MPEYTLILKLNVQHGYFTDKVCRNLLFEPSLETQKLLSGHRLRVVNQPDGIEVYAPVGEANELFISLDKGRVFQWMLRPTSLSFQAVTALPPKDQAGNYRFTNRPETIHNPSKFEDFGGLTENNTALAGSFGSLASLFSFRFSLKGGQRNQVISLGRKPVWNASIDKFLFEKGIDEGSFNPASRTWELVGEKDIKLNGSLAKDTAVKVTYPVAGKGRKDLFAVVDIMLQNGITKKTDPKLSYTIQLKAKKTRWKYLIITSNEDAFSQNNTAKWRLKITDSNIHEMTISELSETKVPDLGNDPLGYQVWSRLRPTLDPSKVKVYALYTKDEIPFQEKLLTGITLQAEKARNTWVDVIPDLMSPTVESQGLKIVRKPNFVQTTNI